MNGDEQSRQQLEEEAESQRQNLLEVMRKSSMNLAV
jgi:hypothetical protein